MKVRINKLISDAGLGSRREAEAYIRAGRVRINERRAQLTDLVSEEDIVYLDDVDLPVRELIQDHLAEEKLQEREKRAESRQRTQSKQTERAESQRQLSAGKSAALRKTSKNNPANRRAYQERMGLIDPEEELSQPEYARPERHRGSRGSARNAPHDRPTRGKGRGGR